MFEKDLHSGSLRLEELPSTIRVIRSGPSVENSITKHRDKAEIIASILEVTSSSGATRNKIAYKSFLSYKILRKYLSFMLEKGLIEARVEKKNPASFISTDRGRRRTGNNNGKVVDLKNIDMPFLNVIAEKDDLVAPESIRL
jgi:predicted transcriptional regulator